MHRMTHIVDGIISTLTKTIHTLYTGL